MSDRPNRETNKSILEISVLFPFWNQLSYDSKRKLSAWLKFRMPLLIGLLMVIFPIYWVFNSAFLPQGRLYSANPALLPIHPTLSNFKNIFFNTRFPRFYLNSIVMSLGVILITTITATLGGYGLARMNIPQKKNFARGVLFGHMFPAILLAIPMFIFWQSIGLINSYIGAIFAMTAVSLPFSLWLMWQFFQSVPVSLEESALMAGAPRFRAFYEIALPLAKPGMIAVATYSYAVSWNQYTIPLIILPDSNLWPLTVGIFFFTEKDKILWPQIMASVAMAIVPSILLVYFLQKYLLRGFRTGGIK